MKFRNFYTLFGVTRQSDSDKIEENISKLSNNVLNNSDKYNEKTVQTIKIAAETLLDEDRRAKYDEIGHEKYVDKYNKTDIDLTADKNYYLDIYDVFDINPNSSDDKIKKQTAKKIKQKHPDNTEEMNTEMFSSLEDCREIITNNRKKYDELGHNKYIEEISDKSLESFNFNGRRPAIMTDDTVQSDDIEELIGIHRGSNSVPVKKSRNAKSDKSLSEAKSDRKNVDKNISSGLFLMILSILSNTITKFILLVLTISIFSYGLYLFFGFLGAGIGFIILLGIFLIMIE